MALIVLLINLNSNKNLQMKMGIIGVLVALGFATVGA